MTATALPWAWHVVDPGDATSVRRSLVRARRGYHSSQLLTPELYAKTTEAQRAGFYAFRALNPNVPVVWLPSGDGRVWWLTRAEADRRARILRWARARDRGLRVGVRELARRLGTSPSIVSRTLRGLERSGAILLELGRGRFAKSRVRAFVHLSPLSRTSLYKGGTLTPQLIRGKLPPNPEAEACELEEDWLGASIARGTALPPPDPALAAGMALLGFRLPGPA